MISTAEFHARCKRSFELLGAESDAVVIVPPFADLHRPSLGVHLLQAAAERAGFCVRVLYANLLFAAVAVEDAYKKISSGRYGWMWGERIFAAAAFGLPPLGYQSEQLRSQIVSLQQKNKPEVVLKHFIALESAAAPFCQELGERLAALRFRVAGATTTFQQTNASVALLAQVKRARPEAITIVGGANCQGDMARGIASLCAPIDYIFSGECETVFPDFLRRVMTGQPLPSDPIVRGEACYDMDSLPEPCFDEYFEQLDNALPSFREHEAIWLPYESSRGCWWGARHHCTFCGLNGQTMAFRQKSPDRMIAGARRLLQRYPTPHLGMHDNIIPHTYFRTVLPRLSEELPPAKIFYETKSNLNLDQVELLQRSGVERIQPGIEAISSSLLRRMKKGVLARQNLALLRYARATGLRLTWNLLYEFPGDELEDYEQTLALMPLIHHLFPPAGIDAVSIDRFSPYFDDPVTHGISHLQPLPAYSWVFPSSANLNLLAYHFKGEYACAHARHPWLRDSIERAYRSWLDSWKVGMPAPTLNLVAGGDDYYTLMDTRGLEGTEMFQSLNEQEARTVLIGGPLDRQPLAEWAFERKLAFACDGWCVPLVVTDADTWHRFEHPAQQVVLPVISGNGLVAS
jgi:ribosomal peptide maturation radical SAM protein 1